VLVVLVVCAAAGCGTIGSDPHAGEQSSMPSTHAYRVWYLDPPWQLWNQTAEHTELHIPMNTSPLVPTRLTGSSMLLDIDVSTSTPSDALASAQADAVANGASVIYPSRMVTFANGVMGSEGAWSTSGGSERVAVVRLPDGRTAVLVFESLEPIQDDADVTAMIGQFETAPMGTH
jgi:hypothetical protein